MRNNQPVSNQEYVLNDGAAIISRTNRKGQITACNEEFVEASGFTRDELIGEPHNMVRHPDMPPEAFRDLWHTLKRGRPWSGMVKNRRKNGDHYWVRANVAPLPDDSGYSSVRIKPTREEVAAAEALYARMRSDKHIRLRGGRVLEGRSRWKFLSVGVSARLILMVTMPLFALLLVAGIDLYGLFRASSTIRHLHDLNIIPIEQLAEINDLGHLSMIALQNAVLAGEDKAALAEQLKTLASYRSDMASRWQRFANGDGAKAQTLLNDYAQKRDALNILMDTASKQLDSGQLSEAAQLLKGPLHVALVAQDALADKLKEALAKDTERETAAAQQSFSRILSVTIAVVLLAGSGAMIFGFVNRNHLLRGILAAKEATRAIARGNLTYQLPPGGDDELGEMISDVAIMRNALHELIASIRQNADLLSRASAELSKAAAVSAESSGAQAKTASGMAAAVEELSVSIDMVDDSARHASQATRKAAESSSEGGAVIHQASTEMRVIAQSIEAASGSMRELQRLSTSISGIVAVIREVADQTNLLALNAAIEAARAGEQGRGFAIVADEVRKLAERTGKATGEISTMISQVQSAAQQAVQQMDDSVSKTASGLTLAERAGASIQSIVDGSREVLQTVSAISDALKEQSVATHEITNRVEEVAHNSEEGSLSATLVAESAQRLEELAQHSRHLAELFRIA